MAEDVQMLKCTTQLPMRRLAYPSRCCDRKVERALLAEIYMCYWSELQTAKCSRKHVIPTQAQLHDNVECLSTSLLKTSGVVAHRQDDHLTCLAKTGALNRRQYFPSAVSLRVRAGNCLTSSR